MQAGRLGTVPTAMFRQVIEATQFSKGEVIDLQFKIEAEIDSISTLESKGFTVVSGPVQGREDSWKNGVHTHVEWRRFQIKPRKRGRLVVPAMTVYCGGNAYRTEPLELVIGR